MSTTPITLTAALLRDLGADCGEQEIFAELFPEGIALTAEPDEETVKQIAAARLDVAWVADALLTADAHVAYEKATESADAAHLEATEPAVVAYIAAIKPAFVALGGPFETSAAGPRAAYRKATSAAMVTYHTATAAADATHGKATASALWRLLADPANWRDDLLERAA